MKLTKCPNGHFYDAEKYTSCPHCSGSMSGGPDDVPTSPIGGGAFQGSGPSDDYTVPIYGNGAAQASQAPSPAPSSINLPPSLGQPRSAMGTNYATNDDDKTVGFMNWNAPGARNASDPKNVFRASEAGTQQAQTSPVVGWLVCIEGAGYGRSFNLYAGQNFIGRSKEMDISLSDPTVARNRHAIIIYEPIHRQFYAQAGESHELFYVNDAVVLTSTQLKDRDVLTIGSAVFVFVPFCDEKYGWIEGTSSNQEKS